MVGLYVMDDSLTSDVCEENEDDNSYGFHEPDHTFGVTRKGKILPEVLVGFSLQLIYFVSAKHHTGYVCKITRDVDKKSR